MRVDKFVAEKVSTAPHRPEVRTSSFSSADGYDIYQLGPNVVVVKEFAVAIHTPQGICYMSGTHSLKYATELAKKYPKT
jgi:hypothetical protein